MSDLVAVASLLQINCVAAESLVDNKLYNSLAINIDNIIKQELNKTHQQWFQAIEIELFLIEFRLK